MAYAIPMSLANALLLATAIWVLGIVSMAAVFGLSSWGVALILFAGTVPLLVAHRLRNAHETTTSQDIQRELR